MLQAVLKYLRRPVTNTYVISDTHFGHTNIINFCNRPFSSVDEMNEHMIEQWNSVVTPSDKVIHVGDFAFRCNFEKMCRFLKRLNGYKILVRGNHDESAAKMLRAGFDKVHDRYEAMVGDEKIVQFEHIPNFDDNNPYDFYVYGHTHNKVIEQPSWARCACVEIIGYKPVLLEELIYGRNDR